MKKDLPNKYFSNDWNVKKVTIKGTNITGIPDDKIYQLTQRVIKNVFEKENLTQKAKNEKINFFNLDVELNDNIHLSIPLIIKWKDGEYCYFTVDSLLEP